ncbi:hypothetical protein HDU84_000575 [Entophlyctis sp. JEL0112]|nr:hypothetical protein HDU84_000575 [Entophlyctis sp. JEL0112]
MSCAPSDIRALASTLGGADGDNSRVPQDGGVADDREYDVSCLDYSYLAKATTKSVPELKRLLDILRYANVLPMSGREGSYPDLEAAFERRIRELQPTQQATAAQHEDGEADAGARRRRDMLDRDAAARDIDAWVLAMKSSSTASAAAAAPSPAVPVRHRLAPRDSAVSIATAASSQTVSSFQDSDLPHSSQLVSSCESSCASSSNSSPASRRASYTSILKASSGFGSSSPAATSSSFPSSTKHVRFLDEVEAARKEADRIKRKQERRKRQIEMHLQQAANSSTVPNSHASTKKNKRKSKTSNSSRKYSGESDSSTGVVEIPFAVDGNDSDEVHEICTPGFQQSFSSAAPIQIPTSKNANSATRIRSYDYRAWDMFDVEKELEKIDELPADREPSSTARINPYKSNSSVVPVLDEPSALFEDDIVATSLAEAEKLKGNESFKAKEYDDALQYYTRSLQIKPNQPSLYNNRSLVHLKLNNYEKAEKDSSIALDLLDAKLNGEMDVDNGARFKALLRRATARHKRAKYVAALADIDAAAAISALCAADRAALVQLRQTVVAALESRGLSPDGNLSAAPAVSHGEPVGECSNSSTIVGSNTTGNQGNNDSKRESAGIRIVDVEDDSDFEEDQMTPDDFKSNYDGDDGICKMERVIEVTEQMNFLKQIDDDHEREIQSTPPTDDTTDQNGSEGPNDQSVLESSKSTPLQPPNHLSALPAIYAVPATASFQFEASWKSLKEQPALWRAYVRSTPAPAFARFLSNVGDAQIFPDVFAALHQLLVEDAQTEAVVHILESIAKVPRLGLLLKLMRSGEKAGKRNCFILYYHPQ